MPAKSSVDHKCPKCASARVHRSHRRTFAEKSISFAGLKIRRCHECGSRFATLGASILMLKDIDQVYRKILLAFLTIVGVILVLLVVVWFSGKHSASREDARLSSPPQHRVHFRYCPERQRGGIFPHPFLG